ncbi:DUF5348 domain-containing protein [Fusobacterium ulcerans]|uniref:DUF5348 domain-containing protein n=1 Tax=Fusobacterium ulcerans 12-1B TaxID=457404 RepID=H1PYS0_9FUSO|nr:DUF5348 domain-containing protein [Fusobacterium ulcerans]EHO77259.1 hypothetical protein HMPREF0402_03563 [Fusobacterium ulcerans 12-1B]
MKKEGVIFFNENLKRYDIGFTTEDNEENYGGLHAGEIFKWWNSESWKWESVRIEYNSDNDTWYLIGENNVKYPVWENMLVRI